jgi:nitroreductase
VTTIDTILARRSVSPRLVRDPGPDDGELRTILSAGARAADHGKMRPWRFIIVRGDARVRLGEVFAACRRQRDPAANEAEIDKERAKPLRAPLMVVVAAHVVAGHPTVRTVDPVHAAAAAAQYILLACFDLGFGAMWLTGSNAHDPNVKRALGLLVSDEIVGFLYVGSIDAMPEPIPVGDLADSVIEWIGTA